jgi:hypothetical protein
MHCIRPKAHLASHDGATCLHVLQAVMAQASSTLETCELSCIGRPDMSSFMYEARNP